MMQSKAERFSIFIKRLEAAPVAIGAEEALQLISVTLNGVEDEYSGVPFSPDEYLNDGRMYPPQADAARKVAGRDDVVRYRSRGHNTWVSRTGCIRITTAPANHTIIEKAGSQGLDA